MIQATKRFYKPLNVSLSVLCVCGFVSKVCPNCGARSVTAKFVLTVVHAVLQQSVVTLAHAVLEQSLGTVNSRQNKESL